MVKKVKKTKKDDLIVSLLICLICGLILILFSFMMPDEPNVFQVNVFNKQNKQNETVVVIDPGHGGYDEGSRSSDGIIEKDLNLEIALKIKALLEEKNIKVVMTRESDNVSWSSNNVEDLQARLDIATNAQALMMVSIHCNFSDEDAENVKGSEVYTNMSQEGSVALARSINDQLEELSPALISRGVKTGQYHLLTFNTIPTVIVEMGFLSNKSDTLYLTTQQTQDSLCQAIVNGMITQIKTDD